MASRRVLVPPLTIGFATLAACGLRQRAPADGASLAAASDTMPLPAPTFTEKKDGPPSCPHFHRVRERFERAADLVVKITQVSGFSSCEEGGSSRFLVTILRGSPHGEVIDSIKTSGDFASILDFSSEVARSAPLLEVTESSCCETSHGYWNLRTAKQIYGGSKIAHFIANGALRLITVTGGHGDTAGVVEYGTEAGATQRLGLPHTPKPGEDPLELDSIGIDGPRGASSTVVVGKACCPGRDTVPISGVTLRLKLSSIFGVPTDATFDYVVRVTNDRLVLQLGSGPPPQ